MGFTTTANLGLIKPDVDELGPEWSGPDDQFDTNKDTLTTHFQHPQNTVPSYSPNLTALTTNPTLGTGGVIEGWYYNIGHRLVFTWGYFQFGTSGTDAGSGRYEITLPFNVQSLHNTATNGEGQCIGTGYAINVGAAGESRGMSLQLVAANRFCFFTPHGSLRVISSSSPWSWGAEDRVNWQAIFPADPAITP